jgi:hypothetical protein
MRGAGPRLQWDKNGTGRGQTPSSPATMSGVSSTRSREGVADGQAFEPPRRVAPGHGSQAGDTRPRAPCGSADCGPLRERRDTALANDASGIGACSGCERREAGRRARSYCGVARTTHSDRRARSIKAVPTGSSDHVDEVVVYLREQWHLLVRADNLLGPRRALAGVLEQLSVIEELLPLVEGTERLELLKLGAAYGEPASAPVKADTDMKAAVHVGVNDRRRLDATTLHVGQQPGARPRCRETRGSFPRVPGQRDQRRTGRASHGSGAAQ